MGTSLGTETLVRGRQSPSWCWTEMEAWTTEVRQWPLAPPQRARKTHQKGQLYQSIPSVNILQYLVSWEETNEKKKKLEVLFIFARHLTPTFRKALLDVCFHVSKDNRIVHEVRKIYIQKWFLCFSCHFLLKVWVGIQCHAFNHPDLFVCRFRRSSEQTETTSSPCWLAVSLILYPMCSWPRERFVSCFLAIYRLYITCSMSRFTQHFIFTPFTNNYSKRKIK